MLFYAYLDKSVLRGFDHYRYSCQDTSPLSNYIMHPFWNQVVKLCPLWVAPNLLTFIGFLCCISHYLIPCIFDYEFRASDINSTSPIPQWAWFLVSLLLFLAHTLDGIDGKQARRTQTSSALGELFDHGCDSWSTLFITVTFYSALGRNDDGFSLPIIRMYLVLWSVFFTFHVSHWEKYNTGVLYLPWSYDLAMLGGTIFYFMTGIVGYQKYKVMLPGDIAACVAVEFLIYFCCLCLSFPNSVLNVIRSYRDGTGKQPSFWESLRPMMSFVVAASVCILWAFWSPNNVISLDPRCFFFMSGTLYANLSCRLIIAQMSGTRSELFNKLLLPLFVCALLSVAMPNVSSTFELSILYILTAIVLAAHLHYVVCVVCLMCQHLKIDCFKIRNLGEQRLVSTNDLDDTKEIDLDEEDD